MTEQEAGKLREILDALEGSPCSFWACDGPDAELVPMKTCNICWAVNDLRELVEMGKRCSDCGCTS